MNGGSGSPKDYAFRAAIAETLARLPVTFVAKRPTLLVVWFWFCHAMIKGGSAWQRTGSKVPPNSLHVRAPAIQRGQAFEEILLDRPITFLGQLANQNIKRRNNRII
jgi:hypothetical protein